MPLHIYNPPCPHADPTSGLWGSRQGQRCGNCLSVPRYQLLTCGPVSGTYAAMGGQFLLERTLKAFLTDGQQSCEWTASVNLFPASPPPAVFGIWKLFYAQGLGYWQAWADMSANIPADIDTYGPDAIPVPNAVHGAHWEGHNWNCLGPNILPIANGGLGFPSTIMVQPLWA